MEKKEEKRPSGVCKYITSVSTFKFRYPNELFARTLYVDLQKSEDLWNPTEEYKKYMLDTTFEDIDNQIWQVVFGFVDEVSYYLRGGSHHMIKSKVRRVTKDDKIPTTKIGDVIIEPGDSLLKPSAYQILIVPELPTTTINNKPELQSVIPVYKSRYYLLPTCKVTGMKSFTTLDAIPNDPNDEKEITANNAVAMKIDGHIEQIISGQLNHIEISTVNGVKTIYYDKGTKRIMFYQGDEEPISRRYWILVQGSFERT